MGARGRVYPRVRPGRHVIVAAPTPFEASGAVDLRAIRSNVERWIAAGLDGVLALGSTGEAIHLDERESETVVAAFREAVPSDKLFVVGTGRSTTAATIRWTNRAAELGADLALVLTPHYYRHEMTPEVLGRHYRAVADSARVPVLLYSMPDLTGVTIPADLVGDLSRHPRIRGLKDSSGDVAGLFDRIARCEEDFWVLNGSGRAVYPALATGASGSVLAIASVAPELAVEAHRAFESGDDERARRAATTLARLSTLLAPYGLGGLKAAMTVRGYRGGICRQPLTFDFKAMRHVETALAEVGLSEQD
jgi:4-hydroxy-2-oxoglutarate aldolase